MLSQRSSMLALIATAMGYPKMATNIMVAGGIASIGVLYVLSSHLGIVAIPLSRIIVQFALILPFFIIAYHKLFKQDRKSVTFELIRSYLPPVATMSFGVLFSYFVKIQNDWIFFMAYLLICLVSVVFILVTLFPSNRNLLRSFAESLMRRFPKTFRIV
jgi:hypothetical protein